MLGERVEAKYSGSDTDSDTEEYCANAHMINPVTGHVEPPRKSPFEGKFLKGSFFVQQKFNISLTLVLGILAVFLIIPEIDFVQGEKLVDSSNIPDTEMLPGF